MSTTTESVAAGTEWRKPETPFPCLRWDGAQMWWLIGASPTKSVRHLDGVCDDETYGILVRIPPPTNPTLLDAAALSSREGARERFGPPPGAVAVGAAEALTTLSTEILSDHEWTEIYGACARYYSSHHKSDRDTARAFMERAMRLHTQSALTEHKRRISEANQ